MSKHNPKVKQGSKLPDDLIQNIQVLYANGCTQRQVASLTGCSTGVVAKYCKDVQRLPAHLQKNPFKPNPEIAAIKTVGARKPSIESMKEDGSYDDIEYWIGEHEIGTPFKGPLDKIPLERLQELMQEPTGYHSKLNMGDWARHYLGGHEGRFLLHPPHLWSKLQYEIFSYWEKHQRLMVETFRDAGKTMCGDGVLTREICEHVDSNYFVMSETRQKAGKRVKHVGDILLTNKRVIADYGFLPHTNKYEGHKQSWKSDEITVKRNFKQTDPSLMAFSSDSSNATGAHFAGGIFDDVWSFSLEQNSQRNKEKWLGWYDGELEGCLENAWEMWLLTRKGPTDLYQDIEDRQFHVVYRKPAVIKFPSKWEVKYKNVEGRKVFDKIVVKSKDWEITDDGNGRFDMEFFLEKMSKMDAVKWESEYQLNAIAAHGRFWNLKNLRYINGYQSFIRDIQSDNRSKLLRVIGFMDLAFGQTERADFTCLAIVATIDNKFYFLENYLKRGATEQDMANMIKRACDEFPMMRTIHIEADLHQTERVQSLKKKCPYVAVLPFLTRQEMNLLYKNDSAKRVNLEKKPLRIWTQLEALIASNRLYINKYMLNYKEWEDEMRTFPSCRHFDVIDAVSNGMSCLAKSSSIMFVLSGT
ncbi:MAG: hypothetical protein GY853_16665 [PVC group bacterium]|nr:hypothetical protein [PVC group bacterium]